MSVVGFIASQSDGWLFGFVCCYRSNGRMDGRCMVGLPAGLFVISGLSVEPSGRLAIPTQGLVQPITD